MRLCLCLCLSVLVTCVLGKETTLFTNSYGLQYDVGSMDALSGYHIDSSSVPYVPDDPDTPTAMDVSDPTPDMHFYVSVEGGLHLDGELADAPSYCEGSGVCMRDQVNKSMFSQRLSNQTDVPIQLDRERERERRREREREQLAETERKAALATQMRDSFSLSLGSPGVGEGPYEERVGGIGGVSERERLDTRRDPADDLVLQSFRAENTALREQLSRSLRQLRDTEVKLGRAGREASQRVAASMSEQLASYEQDIADLRAKCSRLSVQSDEARAETQRERQRHQEGLTGLDQLMETLNRQGEERRREHDGVELLIVAVDQLRESVLPGFSTRLASAVPLVDLQGSIPTQDQPSNQSSSDQSLLAGMSPPNTTETIRGAERERERATVTPTVTQEEEREREREESPLIRLSASLGRLKLTLGAKIQTQGMVREHFLSQIEERDAALISTRSELSQLSTLLDDTKAQAQRDREEVMESVKAYESLFQAKLRQKQEEAEEMRRELEEAKETEAEALERASEAESSLSTLQQRDREREEELDASKAAQATLAAQAQEARQRLAAKEEEIQGLQSMAKRDMAKVSVDDDGSLHAFEILRKRVLVLEREKLEAEREMNTLRGRLTLASAPAKSSSRTLRLGSTSRDLSLSLSPWERDTDRKGVERESTNPDMDVERERDPLPMSRSRYSTPLHGGEGERERVCSTEDAVRMVANGALDEDFLVAQVLEGNI
ncbi:hypothetical protein KIPB_005690 [Kipferlia bialata]|uniref:Uncharacterized protein n=1 Tax=Kipferlia bialata TaxID=797122 RepID=A0A9K3GIP6_9EUKA|nr:hypothetical protein KIPB_005690 [Kipferlia bialata]|eukprot:g5690.t1